MRIFMYILRELFYWDQRYWWVEVSELLNCQSYLRSECVLIAFTFLYLYLLRVKGFSWDSSKSHILYVFDWLQLLSGQDWFERRWLVRAAKQKLFFSKFGFFRYNISGVIYGFVKCFKLKLFVLQLWLHVISGITNKVKNSSKWMMSETLWSFPLSCKTNTVSMKNTSGFLGWQWCSKKENKNAINNKTLTFFSIVDSSFPR